MNRPSLPRSVWVLGFVSLFMGLSSEIIHALLPLFVTVTLGASVAVLGAIDGVAEATASFAKLAGGRLSDKQQKRKPWILAGYGLAAVTKPLMALAGTPLTSSCYCASPSGQRPPPSRGRCSRAFARSTRIADASS